ncbi:MAG: lipid kinase [Bacteroidaceae bacterium]|jgi:YegS/Rv2252/BmrU family lipid kinase|nr:lipid kinase [Bacteroidaceae bacterium]
MIDLHKVNRHRWGIIYSPKAGTVRPMKRWREIREYLVEKGVEYDFLESENYGSAERQARMFADNGYETIVVVGGDGVLQDALNGILSSEHAGNVSLGIIPNGIANDFASYWGLQSGDYKTAINCIIARRIRKVDVGCCSYNTDSGEEKRFFLNALNVGLSARIVEMANEKQSLFAKFVCRITGLVYMLFHRRSFNMRFHLNNQTVDQKLMMLCIGNSVGYGLTPSSVPYNGWLDVSAIRKPKLFSLLEGLLMLVHRRILNYELVTPFRTAEIFIESLGGATVAIDGRSFSPEMPMKVTVEPEKLNLIIPSKINKRK